MKASQFIAVDLGGTKVSAGIFSREGRLLKREKRLLENRAGKAVGTLITELIGELRYDVDKVDGIGVSVPGIAYPRTGKVWAPNIPGWEEYDLKAEIEALWPEAPPAVLLEGDRHCYILGEVWKGAAKGCEDALFLAVGTGIGLGILSGGKVIRGASGISGAIGWMALNRPFQPEYEACGNFEHHASGPGLVKMAHHFMKLDTQYEGVLLAKGSDGFSAQDLFQAYDQGDLIAERVMAQAIQYWGMAVANLVSIFNPEKIILGGGVFGPAMRFLPAIRTEAELWSQPISIRQVELSGSALMEDAGLWGAGFLAISSCAPQNGP